MKEIVYKTFSYEQTKELGKNLAKEMDNVSVVALFGTLGVGKTAFSAGVAEGFNCRQSASSPTYNIVNEYYGDRRVCHFDMYRISGSDQLYEIGWEEYISSGALCLVEWSENVEDALPGDCWRIYINKLDENSREIKVIKC